MSDETQTEQVEAAAPAAPPKKQKDKNPIATASVLIGALGILAVVGSIVVSLLF